MITKSILKCEDINHKFLLSRLKTFCAISFTFGLNLKNYEWRMNFIEFFNDNKKNSYAHKNCVYFGICRKCSYRLLQWREKESAFISCYDLWRIHFFMEKIFVSNEGLHNFSIKKIFEVPIHFRFSSLSISFDRWQYVKAIKTNHFCGILNVF